MGEIPLCETTTRFVVFGRQQGRAVTRAGAWSADDDLKAEPSGKPNATRIGT